MGTVIVWLLKMQFIVSLVFYSGGSLVTPALSTRTVTSYIVDTSSLKLFSPYMVVFRHPNMFF